MISFLQKKFFKKKNPQYEFLRKKWTARHKEGYENLFDKHLKKVAASSLGGLMLLSTPGISLVDANHPQDTDSGITASSSKNALLKAELIDKVPEDARKLTDEDDQKIIESINKNLRSEEHTSELQSQ